ncbi:MAG: UbiD family decarboxylase [Alphaproteobacteria bacterium]|nr:UbiD family decarboxylase [Alphaproteobacteria bacterium]
MTEQSIRPLLDALETARTLTRIVKPVDPRRTLSALAWQAWRKHRHATRFDLPFGHMGWRVASHLLVERSQWARAFALPEAELLFTLRDRLATPIAPVDASRAPVAAVRASPGSLDLTKLPVPLLCAEDAGPRLLAVALARDPASGRLLVSPAECRVLARDRASVAGLAPSLRALHARCRAAGQALPLALVAGAHPALYLAAALAHDLPASDVAHAGALLGAPIGLCHPADGLGGVEVPVPAEAELVIAGTLSADEAIDDGPRGDLLGLYATEGHVPVLHATGVLHRVSPILYAPQTGTPPGDHSGTIGLATELLVARHIRHIEGGLDLLDVRCHPAAGGLVLVVKLRPRVEGQSKTALVGALSGPSSWPKLVIGVDEDVDAADLRDVFWSAASRTHAQLDVGMIDGLPAHPHDVISPRDASGARIATRWFIDSTMPPLTQPERRLGFARAIPRNLGDTALGDFLPPA